MLMKVGYSRLLRFLLGKRLSLLLLSRLRPSILLVVCCAAPRVCSQRRCLRLSYKAASRLWFFLNAVRRWLYSQRRLLEEVVLEEGFEWWHLL